MIFVHANENFTSQIERLKLSLKGLSGGDGWTDERDVNGWDQEAGSMIKGEVPSFEI